MAVGRTRRTANAPMLIAVAVLVLTAAILIIASQLQPHVTTISYSSSERMVTAEEIARSADAVLVARFTGKTNVHWNNSTNKAWTSEETGDWPLIYRDDVFDVVRVIRGELPSNSIVVRGLGGSADGVTVRFDGQVDWQVGKLVLLALQTRDTPLQGGTTESAWVVVANHQGAFLEAGSKWSNDAGVETTESYLAR